MEDPNDDDFVPDYETSEESDQDLTGQEARAEKEKREEEIAQLIKEKEKILNAQHVLSGKEIP